MHRRFFAEVVFFCKVTSWQSVEKNHLPPQNVAPGMVAHWWHRPSPEAFHKETGLGQLKGIHLRGKGVCRAAASSTQ